MPKRIYSADEYLKGLEAQGIVVHDAMRNTVKRLNPHGVIEGMHPLDDAGNPILPLEDVRYEAGHADRVREAQEKIEAFRIAEEEEARRANEPSRQKPPDWNTVEDVKREHNVSLGSKISWSSTSSIRVDLTRPELAALIQHLAASGHSAQRVAELAALLV